MDCYLHLAFKKRFLPERQDRQCTFKAYPCNSCCPGKAISIMFSECMCVALVIQHAKHMRRRILSSVACLAIPYFVALSHKDTIFGQELLNIKCVLIFSTAFV